MPQRKPPAGRRPPRSQRPPGRNAKPATRKPQRETRNPEPASGPPERLQKVLANAGLGARREIEQWIAEGRVSVNGEVVGLGAKVTSADVLRVDGKIVAAGRAEASRRRVLLYHKPEGEVTSRKDPEGRPTVFEHLPRVGNGRWINVGRLDFNTSGLLIFTTDGELVHRLTHPSGEVEREYAVRVLGEVDEEMLERLRQGVELEDGPARFEQLRDAGGEGANRWFHVVLKEGRNREVRRLWETQGVTVSRLIRVRYGPIHLPRNLRPGHFRDATYPERNMLLAAAGLPPETAPKATAKRPFKPRHKR